MQTRAQAAARPAGGGRKCILGNVNKLNAGEGGCRCEDFLFLSAAVTNPTRASFFPFRQQIRVSVDSQQHHWRNGTFRNSIIRANLDASLG